MTSIEFENGQLFYSKRGSGKEILIAFHGFGQDNTIFEPWIKTLSNDYTIFAFDLFHHGKSHRPNLPLSKEEWKELFDEFLAREQIDRFTVIGFSLGGRFAITTSLSFYDKIDQLYLIAPDGIFLTIWFKLATHSMTRWLFKYLMLNPEKLDRLITINERLRIVSPYIGDFVKKEFGDAANRKRVYVSWNHFKTIGYKRRELIQLFNKHSFDRTIILGGKDQVIRPNQILPIIKKMGGFNVNVLPLKHHQLVKSEDTIHLLKSD